MPETNPEKRQLIEGIYQDRAKRDSNTASLAQTIRRNSADALSGEKYLAELLQNADDAQSPSVSWIRTPDGYLILMHEGKAFSDQDVRAICDNASDEREKVSNTEQIGNKGIGFKAVFTIAETVYIFSDGYHFRFDERLPLWRDCVKAYPWQIIPIWTNPEELSNIHPLLDLRKTCFVFKLRAEIQAEVATHLNKLASRHLLFLRHVKKMSIALPAQPVQTRALAAPMSVIPSVTKIPSGDADWLLYQYQAQLPAELKAKLMTAENIPEKYKTVTSMPFKIAILAKGNQLQPVTAGQKVFCYLPTDLDIGMNVLVNAEFLLEPSRMHLRDGEPANAWNQWMLTSLWQGLIQFLSLLAINTSYAHHVFSVLTNPEKIAWGNLERFKAACVGVFKAALQKTPLVRNLSNQKILTVGQVKWDETDFIQGFGTPTEREVCAHPAMQNPALIKELGATTFGIDGIVKAVQTPAFIQMMKDPQQNRRFLECLKTLEERMKQEELTIKIRALLANTALILSSRNELRKSIEVFFPEETLSYATGTDEFLDLLHANLYANESLRTWLSRMNIKAITLAEIIKMANNAPLYSVRFVIHLVKSGAWKKLDARHQTALKSLQLKTCSTHQEAKKNFQPASACYLPSIYQPRRSLDRFTSQYEALLSDEYLAEDVQPADLKAFFIFIGVTEEITLQNLAQFIPAVNKFASQAQCVAFTQWAFATFFLKQKSDTQEKVLSALRELQVFSATGQRLENKLCYLADVYQPEIPLQKHAPEMHFLATDYIAGDQTHISEWRTFFARLGVHQKLAVTPHENLYRNESVTTVDGANEYFSHLEATVENLFPANTRPYMRQHHVTFYLEIPCATSLCSSPILWQLLIRHWASFERHLRDDIVYHTARSEKKVPSNVHVLVEKAVQAKYGTDTKAKDYYPVAVQKALQHYTEGYVFADITEGLTLEQAELLGFKTRLPLEDCATLLRKIAAANQGHEDFSTIIFLYQQILVYIKEGHNDFSILADISLLTHAGSFTPAAELYYLQNDFLHLTEPNASIIKKPQSLSDKDFEKLCQAFSIQSIKRENVEIEVPQAVDSSLQQTLQEKWLYVLNIILDKKDLKQRQARCAEAAKYLQQFQERFALLKIHAATSLHCCYKTVVREPIDLWITKEIDEPAPIVYHTEPLTDVEHEDKQQLYRFLYKHFQLNNDIIDEENFLTLMCATSARLSKKYAQQPDWIVLEEINTAADIQTTPTALSALLASTQVARAASPTVSPSARSVSPMLVDADTAAARAASTQVAASAAAFAISAPTRPLFRIQHPKRSHSPLAAASESAVAAAAHSSPKRLAFLGEDSKSRVEVGKRGERFVYHHLLRKHQEKYGREKIQETPDGYTIQTDHYTKTVRWLNKNTESYKPYDFEITVTKGELQKTRRLEVKATRSHEPSIEINYSLSEWQELKNTDENNQYKLYVVRGISLEDDAEGSLQVLKQAELQSLEAKEYIRVQLS